MSARMHDVMRLLFSLLVFLFVVLPTAHAQVTTGVLSKILRIGVGGPTGVTGTSFTIEVDGRQYLITAKHVVGRLKEEGSVDLLTGEKWVPTQMQVFRCDDPIDIAVLIPPRQLTEAVSLEPTMVGITLGQDAYFAGFPFGYSSPSAIKTVNGLLMIPSVNKGTVSVLNNGMILLDGRNNFGFSGAPIIFKDIFRGDIYKVAGVISGFQPDLVPVTTPVEIQPGEDTAQIEKWRIITLPNGHKARLKDTDQIVPTNTGIVIGYSIDKAVELIRQHPIGPQVSRTQ